MDFYEKKGTVFELSVAHHIEQLKNSIVITHFDVFSFSLARLTPIDILLFYGKHVVVLELKSFTKILSGCYSDRSWIGSSGVKQFNLFNPIIQVKEKLRSLQRKFRTNGLEVASFEWHYFVVVPQTCSICADETAVITENELFYFISKLKRNGEDELAIIKKLMTGG